MKFLNKLIPAFVRKLDKYLLLNYPAVWNLKLHYLIWFQLVVVSTGCLFSFIYQYINPYYTETYWVTGFFTIALVLLSFAWLFLSHQFEMRKRYAGLPLIWEIARMMTYAWALFFVFLSFHLVKSTLSNQSVHHFDSMEEVEFEELKYFIEGFKANHYNLATTGNSAYANGIPLPRRNELHLEEILSPEQVLVYFNYFAQLQNQYGNSNSYTGHELYEKTKTSNNGIFSNPNNFYHLESEDDEFKLLFYRMYQADMAYSYLAWASNPRFKDFDELIMFSILVFGLFGSLIYYYKFFNIRGIVMGFVAPALGFFASAIIVFLLAVIYPRLFNDFAVDITLIFIITGIILICFSTYERSNTKVGLYQTIPLALILIFFYLYYERLRPNGLFINGETSQGQIVLLLFYGFIVVPLYHFGLYKLYLMPKK